MKLRSVSKSLSLNSIEARAAGDWLAPARCRCCDPERWPSTIFKTTAACGTSAAFGPPVRSALCRLKAWYSRRKAVPDAAAITTSKQPLHLLRPNSGATKIGPCSQRRSALAPCCERANLILRPLAIGRGDDGGLWLQYPRAPTYSSRVLATVAGTIPVPVQLLGSQLKPYRVNADRVPIANTDRPWLYASGYEGIEGVRLQLFMSDKEGIVVFPGEAPTLDAKLEPKTWERRYSAPAGKGSSLFLSHDDRALYVGYEVVPPLDRRGKQLPWTTREGRKLPCSARFGASDRSSDTAVWEEDSLEFLISDTSLKTILHFGVGITGGRYDSTWSATGKKENTAANPIWSGAISVQADKAIAEFAVPWQTLRDAGLNLNDLVIRPRTRGPLKRQPHISHVFAQSL